LKVRLEQTRTQLQASNTTGLTGEQISGDMLTATIWSWFAAAESHNRLSQNQANMVENPSLSYGLFHALANPVTSWGVIARVTFPGVNMDIGHLRTMGWSRSNDTSEWVNYNRLRGQYMSALEHAVPERFFNDPSKCNLIGAPNPNPLLPTCPQGVSAVKAIAVAAAQGQRIYTITPQVYVSNPTIVQSQLAAHSQSTRERVQEYLDAGWEVSIHQTPITQDGWTGAGFTVIDQSTGAGGYLIEGGSNGAALFLFLVSMISLVAQILFLSIGLGAAFVVGAAFIGFVATFILVFFSDTDLINPTLLALLRFMTLALLIGFLPLSAAALPLALGALYFAALAAVAALIANFRL
jgi:hypothetical protein